MAEWDADGVQRTSGALRIRHRVAVLSVLVALPFVVTGAQRAIDGMRIAPEKWVSMSHPERREFETFRNRFEGNDVVLISWDGCTVDDPRLQQLEQAILRPDDAELADRHRREIDRVVTGASVLSRLTSVPLNLSSEAARQRLRGILVGPDGRTTCALIVLTYEGNEQRADCIAHLKDLAASVVGVPREALYVAGPPHDGVAIDGQSLLGVQLFSTLCTLLAACLCRLALGSWRITGIVVGIACFGQGLSLAVVHFSGQTLDAILIVMPALIFVLTVSAGVHLANYYAESREQVGEGVGAADAAVMQTVRIGWKPCFLAALTTAVGLASLSLSGVSPVLVFGLVSAACLLSTTALLLLILPGELLRKPVERPSRAQRFVRVRRWFAATAARSVLVRPTLTAMVCGLLMLLSLGGLWQLTTSVDALALFSAESRIVRDYRWFESNIGAVVPVEIAVEIDADSALGFRQRVEFLQRMHAAVQGVEGVEGVVSALTFSPELPQPDEASAFWRTAILYKQMKAHCDEYVAEHYLHEGRDLQSWRITGHVSALAGADYSVIRRRLAAAVGPLVSAQPDGARVTVRYTGMLPLIQTVQTSILSDLFRSFLTAFGLIAVAIGLVLRSLRLTLLAMLPNLFPTALIFGGMGWFRIPVDIGTMMTASVALGIAVDDTIHFLASYRRSLMSGSENTQAVRAALWQCRSAMLQTTVICAAGMLVFCLSRFVPTFRFGLVMALSLSAALLGDLVFLPALLASPLGAWGARATRPTVGSEQPAGAERPARSAANVFSES